MTGAEPIQLWMDSFKPTMLSSNSVLLQGPGRFVVMDGLEATRKIRASQREEGRKIPIIALTANAFREDME